MSVVPLTPDEIGALLPNGPPVGSTTTREYLMFALQESAYRQAAAAGEPPAVVRAEYDEHLRILAEIIRLNEIDA